MDVVCVCVCVCGGGGILNPGQTSAKSTAASKKKVGDRPGKGHDDPIQCFIEYGALEDEGMEVETACSQSSS